VASFGLTVLAVLMVLPITFAESRLGRVHTGAVDDFVEAAAVDPHALAVGTMVGLDALALSHLQFDIADWAVHAVTQCNCIAAWFGLEWMPDDTLKD
jgi:hypothetical protein